jgi:hypothetical protein
MRLVRGVAEGISRFVVHYASPGSREWAEGLAREADFVESDWKALAWSLGSVRVLFSYREAPLRSQGDLSVEAGKYAERMRHRFSSTGGVWIGNLIQALCGIVCLMMSKHLHERIGYSLVVSGFALMTIHALVLRLKAYDVPDRDDPAGMVQYYKTGLERACSPRTLSFIGVVSFIFFAGAFSLVSEGRFFELLIGLVWIALIALALQKRQNNLRRIGEIEAILRKSN